MKQLAIIKGVGYGMRDIGRPCLFFDAMISEGSGALQILFGKAAEKLIKDYGCYDIKNLGGTPIWVNVEGSKITVHSAWKANRE